MFGFFDYKVVLNVPSAVDRWRQTVIELSRVGIHDAVRFEALPDENSRCSFNRSMNGILNSFLRTNKQRLLIMEDDIVFVQSEKVVNSIISTVVQQLPASWDILYLGANLHVEGFKEPVRISDNLCRIFNAWTTHAVAFNRKCVKWIAYNQPQFHDGMFDGWLSTQLHNFNAFCVCPMIAYQREGRSLIWGNDVNYIPVLEVSNEKLLNLK